MAAIEFPLLPYASDATPRLLDFGVTQTPAFGGASQRSERLGSRYALDVQMPAMEAEPDGRIWVSRLMRGLKDGVVFEWPQPDFNVMAPGTPFVKTATAGGTSLPLKGLTPYYPIREGQFFSIIHSSRRYLHAAATQVIADGSGDATVTLSVMLRTNVAVNDVVEIGRPMIEGRLVGDEVSWNLNAARHTGLAFTIEEIA